MVNLEFSVVMVSLCAGFAFGGFFCMKKLLEHMSKNNIEVSDILEKK